MLRLVQEKMQPTTFRVPPNEASTGKLGQNSASQNRGADNRIAGRGCKGNNGTGPARKRRARLAGRAPQPRTAKEIDSSARLPQMSAQLLCKDRVKHPGSALGRRAVALARRVERGFCGKSWDTHVRSP